MAKDGGSLKLHRSELLHYSPDLHLTVEAINRNQTEL